MTDQDTVLEEWRKRGFHGGVWLDPPGQQWVGYVHEVDELFMVLDGEIELEMNGVSLRPEPGKEIVIPAGTVHTVRNVGMLNSRWLYSYKVQSE